MQSSRCDRLSRSSATTSRVQAPAPQPVTDAPRASAPSAASVAALSPGRSIAAPIPKPAAPAARPAAMPSASMPPTGRTIVPGGGNRAERAQHERTGRRGEEQFQCARAGREHRERLGRGEEPGDRHQPCRLAARVTAASASGVTISLPPAAAISATCSGVITVPLLTSILSPKVRADRAMLSSGSGEFSGTSTIGMPIASRTAAIASTQSGYPPRRIGIGGQRQPAVQSHAACSAMSARPRAAASPSCRSA